MWIDRRWLIPGIAASALLNVFLVGILAGHFYADRTAPVERGPVVSRAQVNTLPDDEKKRFLAAMAARRAGILAARKAQQAARHALEAEITAATYDGDRVKAGFAALRKANVVLQEQAHAALVEALATLSSTSRATLVERPAGSGGDAARP